MLRKKKDDVFIAHAERRASPRLPPEAFPSLNGAFLRSGASVELIDISSGGALVESEERLAPNTRISLKIATDKGTLTLHGRILRSIISQLKGTPRYRSGIAFDDKFPLQPENPNTAMAEDIEATAQESFPPTIPRLQVEQSQQPPANHTYTETEETLILTTSISKMAPSLQQYLDFIKINHW